MTQGQLRVLICQEAPGRWRARALEHDIVGEARSIGESVRAVVRVINAHTAFDLRHRHEPLSAFRPAPERCWMVFLTGQPVTLSQLGIVPPSEWDIQVAVADRQPS